MIRVVLADDHALFRESLALLVARETDVKVVGQACDAPEAIELCAREKPHVAVLDLSMRGDGVHAIERIVATCPETRCLALTMHDDAAHLAAVLGAGGAGYLVKGSTGAEFLLALRSVAAGRSYIRVSVGDAGLREVTGVRKTTPPAAGLSSREREVLQRVAKGFSSREIAEQLGLKLKTVESHRNRLRTKLGVNGRAALVDYALREGLVQGT